MRAARIDDYWRHIYSREYPTKLISFKYKNTSCFCDDLYTFTGGITAICGPNGAGKSTLLKSIIGLLGSDESYLNINMSKKIISGQLIAELLVERETVVLSQEVKGGIINSNPLKKPNVILIDSAKDSPHILNSYIKTTNIGELLETVEAKELSTSEIEIYSYVVGKHYEKIVIYELEDMFGKTEVPYFEVRAHGVDYKTEDMGLGEFSIFYIIWTLNRSDKLSIILIEEPECFISPRSQSNLINYIAKTSDEKRIWCIITTHSDHTLKNIPIDHIRMLIPGTSRSRLIQPNSTFEYLSSLGLNYKKSGLFFVEDRAAKEFLRLLLCHYDQSVLARFDIVIAGSDQHVLKALNAIPKDTHWLELIGIIDGDMQNKAEDYKSKWPIIFLPGSNTPDKILMSIAYNNIPILADKLLISESTLSIHLAGLAGRNYHDWCYELHNLIGITYEQLVSALFSVWISDDENEKLANDVCLNIHNNMAN